MTFNFLSYVSHNNNGQHLLNLQSVLRGVILFRLRILLFPFPRQRNWALVFPKGTELANVGFPTWVLWSTFRTHLPTCSAFSRILYFLVGQNTILLAKQRVTSIFSTRASQIWAQRLSSQTLEGEQRPSTARINELVKAGQEQPHSFAQYAVQIIPILSMLWYEKYWEACGFGHM